MGEVIERAGLAPGMVDQVFWGVGDTSPCKDVYTPVAARQTLLKAGLPPETVSISLDKALELKVEPLASIVAMTSIAIDPSRMPEAPGNAMKKVLNMADLALGDIDFIEINEAFAAVPLVSLQVLCDRDEAKARSLHEKTNVNGSAIAIGHPNTASGARIIMNLMYELRRKGGGFAIGAICGGLAQADACIIKV
jgi:acetyl-CoA C-acetyltransferase